MAVKPKQKAHIMMSVVRVDKDGVYVKAEGQRCRPTGPSAVKVGDKYRSTMASGFASIVVWLDTGRDGRVRNEPWIDERTLAAAKVH